MGIITGKEAIFRIKVAGGTGATHEVYGLSDFSLTIDRDTIEQELLGQEGNYFDYGALSLNGSFTMCKFASSGHADALKSIVESEYVSISGMVKQGDTSYLRWYLPSCTITSYSIDFGDASTITEASIDWQVLEPYRVTYDTDSNKITQSW